MTTNKSRRRFAAILAADLNFAEAGILSSAYNDEPLQDIRIPCLPLAK
jgi:hypothetical protein